MQEFLSGVQKFREFLLEVGAAQSTLALPSSRMLPDTFGAEGLDSQALFASLITEPEIANVSGDLFASGHFSLAIQEACKALEKFLQAKSGHGQSGSTLMDNVFSPNAPKLFWSNRTSQSQKDEQLGYHRLFTGVVLGIRNPCTHEFNWVEEPSDALDMMLLIQHLLRKAKAAKA